MNNFVKSKANTALVLTLASFASAAAAQDCPIKVGILHSETGHASLEEKPLKDAVELLIALQNAKGGLLGCPLQAVSADPASDDKKTADLARVLAEKKGADVIFGGWTSSARKALLPVVEETNTLLFYPARFEGEESARNVFYTGATPNQQALPAANFMLENQEVELFYLIGTDSVYSRKTNEILRAHLAAEGVADEDIVEVYAPYGEKEWSPIVEQLLEANEGDKYVGVLSTIDGDDNVEFYKSLIDHEIEAADVPVMSLSIGEVELRELDPELLSGHLATWSYFQSAESPENEAWVSSWKAKYGADSVTNAPIEAHYIGFNMWVNAVTQAGSTESDAVRTAMHGQELQNLSGGMAKMQGNHTLSKPALVGEIDIDGQFYVVSEGEVIAGDVWPDVLEGYAKFKTDWVKLNCAKYDTEAAACLDTSDKSGL